MSKKLYKYFSSEMLDLVFNRPGFCGIKCSFPKDYNDPFELFLGVDLSISPQSLATYRDIVQDLPQFPTTCFSNSPIVAPMWAHYAKNHSGFVLEFDADELQKNFQDMEIRDVEYKDDPDPRIAGYVERAAVVKKFRHAIWLQNAVLSQAYFSKNTAWSYEQECRLVAENSQCEDISGNMILFIPIDCVSSIIIGSKFPESDIKSSIDVANRNGLHFFQSVIGKSLPNPFMTDEAGDVFTFNGERIELAEKARESCLEPIAASREFCAWCSITSTHELKAARGNPLRALDHLGLLEGYYEEVRKIERGSRRRT